MQYLKINSALAQIHVANTEFFSDANHIEFLFRKANITDSFDAYHVIPSGDDSTLITYQLTKVAESRPLLINRNKQPYDDYEPYVEPAEELEPEVETSNDKDLRYNVEGGDVPEAEYYKRLKEYNDTHGIKVDDKLVTNLETGAYFIAEGLEEDAQGNMVYKLLGEDGPLTVSVADFKTEYMFAEVTQPGQTKKTQYTDDGQSVDEVKERIRELNSKDLGGGETTDNAIDIEPEIMQRVYYSIYEDIDSEWSPAAKTVLNAVVNKQPQGDIKSDIIDKVSKAFKSLLLKKTEEYGIPLNAFIKFIRDANLPLNFSSDPYEGEADKLQVPSSEANAFFDKLYNQIKVIVDKHISAGKKISTPKLDEVLSQALAKRDHNLDDFKAYLQDKNLYSGLYGKSASVSVDTIIRHILASI